MVSNLTLPNDFTEDFINKTFGNTISLHPADRILCIFLYTVLYIKK